MIITKSFRNVKHRNTSRDLAVTVTTGGHTCFLSISMPYDTEDLRKSRSYGIKLSPYRLIWSCVRAKTKNSPDIILKAHPVCDGSFEAFSDYRNIWRHTFRDPQQKYDM